MPEVTTTATFTAAQFDEDALTTIVARSVLEAALAEGEGAELWFDVGHADEASRLSIDLSTADLEEMLRLAGEDDVALTLDGEYVSNLFDDADVEAHGMRGAIAIAVTGAALLAPATQAAVPQATQQAKPQVGAAATAQVSSMAARTQATLQNKLQTKTQVSKVQVAKAKVSGLQLLRSGLAR